MMCPTQNLFINLKNSTIIKQFLLKKPTFLSILLLSFAFILTNCSQDRVNQDSLASKQTPEEQAIELTKKYLNESHHNLLVLEVTKTIDWEHAIVTNGDNGLIVEVPLILMDNLETSFEKIRDLKSFHRLFFVSQDNSFRLFHLIITTSNKKFDNNSSTFNYYNLQQDFSGYTMILDANNEVTNLYKYNKGKKLTIKDIELTKKEAVFCTYFGWWSCSTSTDICSFQSLYLVGCSNLGGGDDYGTGGGYHGGFGGGGGGNTSNPGIDEGPRISFDTSFEDNEKANCTYQKILEVSDFLELIEEFTGEENPNLTFQIVPNLDCNNNGSINEGCSSNSLESNNSITISIDEGFINSSNTPTLMIAQTIIHESIHANLYLAVYNHENGNPVNLPDINDFPAIYEKYMGINGLQHEVMAELYTDLIAQILKQVHPLLNDQQFIDSLDDYDFSPEEFYTSLAYVGLNGTVGQTNYLSNPENAENYSISFYYAEANSTKEPNCD